MKTQEFIESGILEAHLLGLTDKEEQEKVREMVSADPALEEYTVVLEAGINTYFERESVNPPEAVREVVRLRSTRAKKEKHEFTNEHTSRQYLDVEVNDTHMKVHKFWRPAFIAVFVLSKIFLIAGLYYYFKSVSQQEELQRLKAQQIEQVK
ncbi:hypothetical protein DYBT9623_03326 [Dyadobacter sp. CECT 9623]|uniref:Anti-sigma factor n=1 Tax=Dyadobacter linearis TaxID=2823330 RepID=A0ABM8USR6_9BACT|nr:hypothetical protein [Dyadobacter sp. CECT 9623]CAG5071059.1 hypothetical protein DYBT9623_03326 [Dyadobacter sp. CECT 9623]